MSRRLGELAAAGIGLAVMGYLGWDGALWDARFQLALHLAGVAGAGGLLWFALAGGALPRTRLEMPVLALLLAFGIASLSAWNLGLSAQALAAIIGTVLVLPAAAIAIRRRPTLSALVICIPILALAAYAIFTLGERRLDWILAGGPGLPPVRLGRESTAFGSVAVPPFVLLATLPITLLIADPRVRRWLQLALIVAGVPLTVLSGSRSAWIAIVVAAAIVVAPPAWRFVRGGQAWRWLRDPQSWTPRGVAAGFALLVLGAVAIAFVAPRLTDVRSLIYRGFLWRDTITAWSADPLLGLGPGSMPYARQAAAPPLSFPVHQPHSHDIPLGILGDAGIFGLLAVVVVVVTFVVLVGPWRTRSLAGRAAFAVLAGCAVGMLFEDLTFIPGFNILVMVLAAMALADAGAIRWQRLTGPDARAREGARLPRTALAAAASLGAVALLAIMLLGDASAIAYRGAADAAGEEHWPQAYTGFRRAVALDPWQPTGPKSLAVAADRVGRRQEALAAARRAVMLNPGDGPSWTNIAVLCRASDDRDCARAAADRAVDTASAAGRELANAAAVYDWLGDVAAADRAYRLSLLTNFWTGITMNWPRNVQVGDGRSSELDTDAAELNLLIARRVTGEPIRVSDYAAPVTRALADAMLGDRNAAQDEIGKAIRSSRDSTTVWEIAALLAKQAGHDPQPYVAISDVARGAPLTVDSGRPQYLVFDIATFRAYPADGLVTDAIRLRPAVPWPWALEPYLGR
ncbi:MAG TPA: O-antigen ligase family protein [Candidatus Limnocylindria bacterium]|nr:O-antigen ligase family protein [Candidatus Limnocylindria bacterium]